MREDDSAGVQGAQQKETTRVTATRELPITVRMATDSDRATASTSITTDTARGHASLALLRAGQGMLWVAVEGAGASEKLVGMLLATAQITPETYDLAGYIHELLVHPGYRRRGVAMHLLDVAERYFLEEHDFALVFLATSPENDAALRLYRSRGYTVTQVRLSKPRTASETIEDQESPQ